MLFLPQSLSHSHYCKSHKIVKDLESARLCSKLHQLIIFHDHCVLLNNHHMQPDVLNMGFPAHVSVVIIRSRQTAHD